MSIYQHSLVLLLVALSPVATAQWNGYINKKTHPESRTDILLQSTQMVTAAN